MEFWAPAIILLYTSFYFWFLVALALELSRARLRAIADMN